MDRGSYLNTDSKFWSWFSSQLRKIWAIHPTKLDFIKSVRYGKRVGNRILYYFKCNMCMEEFQIKHMEVDHIKSCGSIRDDGYAHRMMNVGFEDLQALCKSCHSIKTYSDVQGVTLEEARIEKQVIAFRKLPAIKQKEKLGPESLAKNVKERCDEYRERIRNSGRR